MDQVAIPRSRGVQVLYNDQLPVPVFSLQLKLPNKVFFGGAEQVGIDIQERMAL